MVSAEHCLGRDHGENNVGSDEQRVGKKAVWRHPHPEYGLCCLQGTTMSSVDGLLSEQPIRFCQTRICVILSSSLGVFRTIALDINLDLDYDFNLNSWPDINYSLSNQRKAFITSSFLS